MKNIESAEIKNLITDFDGTLWQGSIAEGEIPHLNSDYYHYLVDLYRKGVVIIGISKNDKNDIQVAIQKLNINKEIFLTVIANWQPKTDNIHALFQQLSLKPSSSVFIDDNPLERSDARALFPELHVLDFKEWRILQKNSYLKDPISTERSIKDRYKKYRHALKFFDARAHFDKSDKEFLYSRNRSIQIGSPASEEELYRVAELFFRTNRLNFNPRKLSSINESTDYIRAILESGGRIYSVSVKDGGESLGIQAAFTVTTNGSTSIVNNGTISCSMISFGDFEGKILNELLKTWFKHTNKVEILVRRTKTNTRIFEILKKFHFKLKCQDNKNSIFSLKREQFKEISIPWIKSDEGAQVDYDYFGVPAIRNYFLNREWDKIPANSHVLLLGSGQGETLGLAVTNKLFKHLQAINTRYDLVDIEDYGFNIVANAENLKDIYKADSVDYIICAELLEHTEHYWRVINELLRILKISGRAFVSVPFNFPAHEYPIDKWRLSFEYLKETFGICCKIEDYHLEGDPNNPRHILLSLTKTGPFLQYIKPKQGYLDPHTGLTYIFSDNEKFKNLIP
ncbi:HAD-IIIC family phosphatase [Microbulbifer variabilis]|uniref:HAD-IIIC family phosphatase n=1 Tax=Microbulbifer variabilis TaxID=266805 RepID=UPI001CFD620F|nr:HAD-IIIC family phosphatase [Microbulbifer variabilis]